MKCRLKMQSAPGAHTHLAPGAPAYLAPGTHAHLASGAPHILHPGMQFCIFSPQRTSENGGNIPTTGKAAINAEAKQRYM